MKKAENPLKLSLYDKAKTALYKVLAPLLSLLFAIPSLFPYLLTIISSALNERFLGPVS